MGRLLKIRDIEEQKTESEAVLRIRRKMQEEEAHRMKKWGIIWLCVLVVVFVIAYLAGGFPETWWQWLIVVCWFNVPVLSFINSRRLLKGKKPR